MNKKITRAEFASSVDRSLSGLRPDPDLCRRIISSEKGVRMEKRKVSIALIAAIMLMAALVTVAVAEVLGIHLGIDLFRFSWVKPLDGAEEIVETHIGSVQDEYVRISVEEAVYDGRGASVLFRIESLQSDRYVLEAPQELDYPQEDYDMTEVPRPVGPNAQLEFPLTDGTVYVRPTYEKDGILYYADATDRIFTRKDGREYICVHASCAMDDGNDFLDAWRGEKQADGSVLIMGRGFTEETIEGDVGFRVKCVYALNGDYSQKRETTETQFVLKRVGATLRADIIPGESTLKGCEIIKGDVYFTPVCGYLTLIFADNNAQPGMSDLYWSISKPDGTAIPDGDSETIRLEDGTYRLKMELEPMEELPEYLYLEAISWDDDSSYGKVKCVLKQ
jgi:hypothetical protein